MEIELYLSKLENISQVIYDSETDDYPIPTIDDLTEQYGITIREYFAWCEEITNNQAKLNALIYLQDINDAFCEAVYDKLNYMTEDFVNKATECAETYMRANFDCADISDTNKNKTIVSISYGAALGDYKKEHPAEYSITERLVIIQSLIIYKIDCITRKIDFLKTTQTYKSTTPVSLSEYLEYSGDKDELVSTIKELSKTAKGRDVAIVIKALEHKKYLAIPNNGRSAFYRALKREIGEIGSEQSINSYYINAKGASISDDEITRFASKLP